jgi:transcriptional regulator with XRE-family HTH domain
MADKLRSIMHSEDLAALARAERTRRGLSQAEVARRVAERPDTSSCSRQAVSQAEDAHVGTNLDGLRVKIIETLTGRRVEGPAYYFADQSFTLTE